MINHLSPARTVFLTWALIIFIGFFWTHNYQHPNINYIWTFLSIVGLGVMYKYMPLRALALRNTYFVWLGVILFGMFFSFLPFYYEPLGILIAYLGIFWLVVMGVGHILNGVVYPSLRKTFYLMGILQIMVGVICYFLPDTHAYQYVIAGVVGGLAMLQLFFKSN